LNEADITYSSGNTQIAIMTRATMCFQPTSFHQRRPLTGDLLAFSSLTAIT